MGSVIGKEGKPAFWREFTVVSDKDGGKSIERGYYPGGGNGEAGVVWRLTSLAWATNSITSYQVIKVAILQLQNPVV